VTSKVNAILVVFTEGNEHSLTEIARFAGLPISTAHRLTSELTTWRLLERTVDGQYRPGLALRMISKSGPCPLSLFDRGPAVLEDLSAATKVRSRLGVIHDLHVSYIEKQPGNGPVTSFNPAARLPVHPTALGRAMLAFAPPSTVEAVILCGFRSYTARTVASPDRFRRSLAVTRLTKVAVTRGELEPGAGGVAMPVFGPGGNVVAALELTITDEHRDLHPFLGPLAIACRSLSRELASARSEQRA
jgi:DNA-binding IclR family transcriptional regulator